MSTELSLQPTRPTRNKVTGRFLPGHVPANKGKTWDETMSKRGQRNAKKGWKNLEKGHAFGHPAVYNAGRCRKPTVAVTDDGHFYVFSYLGAAAEWLSKRIGKSCARENIGRCCRDNQSRKPLHKAWDKSKGLEPTKAPNTDHRYMGIRFYFESDKIWYSKIRRNG